MLDIKMTPDGPVIPETHGDLELREAYREIIQLRGYIGTINHQIQSMGHSVDDEGNDTSLERIQFEMGRWYAGSGMIVPDMAVIERRLIREYWLSQIIHPVLDLVDECTLSGINPELVQKVCILLRKAEEFKAVGVNWTLTPNPMAPNAGESR